MPGPGVGTLSRIDPKQASGRSLRRGLTTLALAAGLTGCGGDGPGAVPEATRRDSVGVEIVASSGRDRALAWRAERRFDLGGAESGPEAFYSVGRGTVAVGPAGRIHVLDAQGHRVVVFDGEGRHLRTFGRQGEGPGELAWPISLEVEADGTVAVEDLGRGGWVRFAPDGSPLETRPRLPDAQGGGAHFGPGATLWAANVGGIESAVTRQTLKRATGADTIDLASLEFSTIVVQLESCGMSFAGIGPVFAPRILWDARGETVAVAAWAEYRVDLFRGAEQVRSLRRDVPPREATEALAVREIGDGMRVVSSAGERVCDAEEVVEQRGVAPVVPAVGSVTLDPAGRVWVRRGVVEGEAAPLDVFAADGAYLGTLSPDFPSPIGFLADGRLLAVEEDELEVERLVVYELSADGEAASAS